jgi:hypothetical protein
MEYKPEVLWECRVFEVFPEGIAQRVEIIGENEPLGKYVSPGAMKSFFVPVQRVIALPKESSNLHSASLSLDGDVKT